MKILMIGNHETVHGGITSVIQQILKHDWDKENVKIQFLPSYKGGNSLQKVICFLGALMEYEKIIRTETPELIYIHMSHHGSFDRAWILQKIAKKHSIPTVIHLHGSEFADFYEECSQKKKARIRNFFQESGAVITLGEIWSKFITSISPTAHVYILRNSVHIPDYIVEQKQSEVNVLFLGVLIKRKGVVDLLQAVNTLVHDTNIGDFSLKINIGGTGPEEELLKSYVIENHLEEYVNFLGWIDGKVKDKVLSMNQVYALPSYNEGLPISILEAISYGMPVIATNVGSVAEAVENEKNGFTFEPGNVQGYADALYRLITDYPLRLSMANASRRIAETYYDEKKYFVRLNKIFRSVTL